MIGVDIRAAVHHSGLASAWFSSKKKFLKKITSNFWTHAWNIKYRLKN